MDSVSNVACIKNDFGMSVNLANWLIKTVFSSNPFEYECKVNPDNNGYLTTENGVIFHFDGNPRLKGRTIVVSKWSEETFPLFNILEYKVKNVAIKNVDDTPEITANMKVLMNVLKTNKVVLGDISKWFYDNKTFVKNTKDDILASDEFKEFIKFITNEIVFFAKHGDVPFSLNRRERAWFKEILCKYLIKTNLLTMFRLRNNWHAIWYQEMKLNAQIISLYIAQNESTRDESRVRAINNLSIRNRDLKKMIKASERAFDDKVNNAYIGGYSWRSQLKTALYSFETVMKGNYKKYIK